MILYREQKQKIITGIGLGILVVCLGVAAFSVFTTIMKVSELNSSIAQLHEENDKFDKDLAKVKDESFGIISEEVASAKEIGEELAVDEENLAKSYDMLMTGKYNATQKRDLESLFRNMSMKLDVVSTASPLETLSQLVWTNNPKVDIRFESILNYTAKDIPCLYTMWLDDKLYGYLTCTYDIQNGVMKKLDLKFTEFGKSKEKAYGEIVIPQASESKETNSSNAENVNENANQENTNNSENTTGGENNE